MDRRIRLYLSVIELVLAGFLIVVGCLLPRPNEVQRGFGQVDAVARSAEKQVQLVRIQVDEVRGKDFPGIAAQLSAQTKVISNNVRASSINFGTIEATSDALAATAHSLEGLADNLQPNRYQAAIDGLGAVADLLESYEQVTTGISPVDHRQLMMSIDASFTYDCRRQVLLSIIHATLHDLVECLRRVNRDQKVKSLLQTIEFALWSSIDPIDPRGNSSFGFPNHFNNRVQPAVTEMEQVVGMFPDKRSRFSTANTDPKKQKQSNRRRDFGSVDDPESFPAHANRLIPADLLFPRAKLRGFATDFRKAQRDLNDTLQSWPQLAASLRQSAHILKESRSQMESVLIQRGQYEQAILSSEQITRQANDLLQACTLKLDSRLREQDRSLGQMESDLTEIRKSVPAIEHSTSRLFMALRLTFWLAGSLIGVHGCLSAAYSFCRGGGFSPSRMAPIAQE